MDQDTAWLIRDKYGGNSQDPRLQRDLERLAQGEPLAYVIGSIPFLGLTIHLDSRPLIPRPETEWWVELLTKHIGDAPVRVLDLCAGSGAVGLSVLAHCPHAHVSFGEVDQEHEYTVRENLIRNHLDPSRATIRIGDLFEPFKGEHFTIIATNPPYIPEHRVVDESVSRYEPSIALYAGEDGLSFIRRIASEYRHYMDEGGQLWLECDAPHAAEAAALIRQTGATEVDLLTDPYERPRLIVAY